MKLTANHLGKIDALLREALTRADEGEVLRTIMVLREAEEQERAGHTALAPKQFSSRAAYRGALLNQRSVQIGQELQDTLQALTGLSLLTRGGATSRTLVVEGAKDQILSALNLPGVRHATLDQPLELVEPKRNKRGVLKQK